MYEDKKNLGQVISNIALKERAKKNRKSESSIDIHNEKVRKKKKDEEIARQLALKKLLGEE